MIVPMKKVFLLVQDKDLEPALLRLRDMGVLHVEHIRPPAGEDLNKLKEEIKLLEQVILYLTHEHKNPAQVPAADWEETADVILGLAALRDGDKEGVARRQVQIVEWEPWGDFSLEDIALLRDKGIKVELVEVPEKEIPAAPEGIILERIFTRRGVARCLALSYKDGEIPYKILPLPYQRLSQLKEEQQRLRKRMEESHQKLLDDSKYLDYFQKLLARKNEQHTFQSVKEGSASEAQISYVKGFCPADRIGQLEAVAKEGVWGLSFEDPGDGDQVPTLLRNPAWVRLVNPLFDFMNIIPGYREADVSLCFLLFFSVFFGILIGDAGYGLTFLGLTLWARKKAGPQADQTPFELMIILSVCTVIWGALTGTFFGQTLFGKFVRPLWPWVTNDINMQRVCFMIGITHLTIAHVWRGIRKWPALTAWSEIGWLSLLWGSYFLAGNMLFNRPLPGFVRYLFYLGPVMVVLFNQPEKNFLKRVGLGLGDLFLTVMSMFVDLLSYIRLFAVGMAGLLLADSFNQMFSPFTSSNFIAGLISAVVLVVMHVLNMTLSIIAVLVHGLRLNIFEFSSHLGIEWSGGKYSPLRRTES